MNLPEPELIIETPEFKQNINEIDSAVSETDSFIAKQGSDYFNNVEGDIEVKPAMLYEVSSNVELEDLDVNKIENFEPTVTSVPEVEVEQVLNTTPATENSAASLFEQRQKQYLNGRRSTKTISDNAGNVIVEEGVVITNDLIELAKQNGKLIELVMNNKA